MRRLLTGLLIATLLLGACGDDDSDDSAAVTSIPDETSTSTTSTTSTTEPAVPPPDVIPGDPSLITEEYVEQVLEVLFEASNEALRLTMEAGGVDDQVIRLVRATTPDEQVENDLNGLVRLASEGFPGVREDPGPITSTVVEVVEAKEDCVFAEVLLDDSAVADQDTKPAGARSFVRLVPATEEQKSSGLNRTAWVVAELPVTVDGRVPDERC